MIRPPTPQQSALMRAIADGRVFAFGGRQGGETYRLEVGNDLIPVTGRVEAIIGRGWAARVGDYRPGVGVSDVTLTDAGRAALAEHPWAP